MAITYRIKCPACGHVFDTHFVVPCPKCGAQQPVVNQAMLRLYRMGNFFGSAGGFGIYINGQPFGHIGNTQCISIPLPFGTYTLHMSAGMTKSDPDLTMTLHPGAPLACVKARLQPGAWRGTIKFEIASPAEMPNE